MIESCGKQNQKKKQFSKKESKIGDTMTREKKTKQKFFFLSFVSTDKETDNHLKLCFVVCEKKL